MMSSYRGIPRFEEAVMNMARSPKPLKERLVEALHHISSCDLPGSLPDEVMDDFKRLWARCTRVDPEAADIAGKLRGEGRIVATCMTMSDEEAAEVADDIVRIHHWCDEIWHEDD